MGTEIKLATRGRTSYTKAQVVFATMVGAAIATLVAMVAGAAIGDAAGESTYVPLTPERILDTRAVSQIGEHATAWPADTVRSLKVTDLAGVPATGVEAVVLNITTVNPTTPTTSFLTVYPQGTTRPNAASLNFVQGEIKNDIVIATVDTNGRINIYNQLGNVHLIIDVNGYYTSDLEARVANLEVLLAGMTRTTDANGNDTLQLAGANLQITNGTNTTYDTQNGTGNLIIGMNDEFLEAQNDRTGSHNLIVGDNHDYTANGTVVFGLSNTTTGQASAVTGGSGNLASGMQSSVTGGVDNDATAGGASVTGGGSNLASGPGSSVTGGSSNIASELLSSVTGGTANEASALHASVTAGFQNIASGDASSVAGGDNNIASGNDSFVAGGSFNEASEMWSVVIGGEENMATEMWSVVIGGLKNTASGHNSVAVGGGENDASGDASVVSGGASNVAGGGASVISGGTTREVTGEFDWRAGELFQDE